MRVRMYVEVDQYTKLENVYVKTGTPPGTAGGNKIVYTWTINFPEPKGLVDLGEIGVVASDE